MNDVTPIRCWRLPLPAQRLFARLVTRKGPWLRLDKLDYAEITDRDAAVAELCDLGIVERGGRAPADTLLRC